MSWRQESAAHVKWSPETKAQAVAIYAALKAGTKTQKEVGRDFGLSYATCVLRAKGVRRIIRETMETGAPHPFPEVIEIEVRPRFAESRKQQASDYRLYLSIAKNEKTRLEERIKVVPATSNHVRSAREAGLNLDSLIKQLEKVEDKIVKFTRCVEDYEAGRFYD